MNKEISFLALAVLISNLKPETKFFDLENNFGHIYTTYLKFELGYQV